MTGEQQMYSMDEMQKPNGLRDLAPEIKAAFRARDKAALAEGAIPKKYKELIAIAAALTTQCPYCIEFHRQQAIEAGATERELGEVTFVANALRAGGAIMHDTHLLHNLAGIVPL
jgi:AhpD family alkylhydroperoxidase